MSADAGSRLTGLISGRIAQPHHESTCTGWLQHFSANSGQREREIITSGNAAAQSGCDSEEVSLRCVIVDDNPCYLAAPGDRLEREGMRVVAFASTGAEALQQTRALDPDLVLVDIDLGEESGFDVARRLAAAARPETRVILISVYAEGDFADLIEESPAIGFVSKCAMSAGDIRAVLRRADASERRGR